MSIISYPIPVIARTLNEVKGAKQSQDERTNRVVGYSPGLPRRSFAFGERAPRNDSRRGLDPFLSFCCNGSDPVEIGNGVLP